MLRRKRTSLMRTPAEGLLEGESREGEKRTVGDGAVAGEEGAGFVCAREEVLSCQPCGLNQLETRARSEVGTCVGEDPPRVDLESSSDDGEERSEVCEWVKEGWESGGAKGGSGAAGEDGEGLKEGDEEGGGEDGADGGAAGSSWENRFKSVKRTKRDKRGDLPKAMRVASKGEGCEASCLLKYQLPTTPAIVTFCIPLRIAIVQARTSSTPTASHRAAPCGIHADDASPCERRPAIVKRKGRERMVEKNERARERRTKGGWAMMMLVASCGERGGQLVAQVLRRGAHLEDLNSLVDLHPPRDHCPRQEERRHKAAQCEDPHSRLPPRIIFHSTSSHTARKSNQSASNDPEWSSE